jgi:Family of unknown function (DUF6151)
VSGVPPRDLQLECRCGMVRAVARGVTPQMGNHCVCYCDDCQAFPKALGRSDVVDANGGTDIFQLSQARLEFTHGLDRVAWLQLTPKGTARWYASCCNTPIGNTLPTRGVPFVGVIRAFIREPAGDALGPIRARVFREFATGDVAAIPPDNQSRWTMFLRLAGLIISWRLRGDHKRSPFFDAASGAALKAPRILSEAERAALR